MPEGPLMYRITEEKYESENEKKTKRNVRRGYVTYLYQQVREIWSHYFIIAFPQASFTPNLCFLYLIFTLVYILLFSLLSSLHF